MESSLTRRRLLAGAASLPVLCGAGGRSERSADAAIDAAVFELHASLTARQRTQLCFPADHRGRRLVHHAWFVGEPCGTVLDPRQQELALRVFLALHAPSFRAEVQRQIEEDNEAPGVSGVSLGFFGTPASKDGLGLVFAGRHVTRRWEEHPVRPFDGPIFSGHAHRTFDEPPDHPGNVWWYQGRAANRLFQALAPEHRELALSSATHLDRPECLDGPRDPRGLLFAELDPERLELARDLVEGIVARPYRASAGVRALSAIEGHGGITGLSLHFFRGEDYGSDGVYDNFEIWGPGLQCHYRGAPHPHSWLRVDA